MKGSQACNLLFTSRAKSKVKFDALMIVSLSSWCLRVKTRISGQTLTRLLVTTGDFKNLNLQACELFI